jgi:hypothetical protein
VQPISADAPETTKVPRPRGKRHRLIRATRLARLKESA